MRFYKDQVVEVRFVDLVGDRWVPATVERRDHRWPEMYDVKPLGPDVPAEMGTGRFMVDAGSMRARNGGA